MKKIFIIATLALMGCATHYDAFDLKVYCIEKNPYDTNQLCIYAEDPVWNNKMMFLAYPNEGFKIGSRVIFSAEMNNTRIVSKKTNRYCLVKKFSPTANCFVWAIYNNGIPVDGYYTISESLGREMYHYFVNGKYNKTDTVICGK
jgi:hypothetical protein